MNVASHNERCKDLIIPIIDLLETRPSVFAGLSRRLKSNLAMAFALLIVGYRINMN